MKLASAAAISAGSVRCARRSPTKSASAPESRWSDQYSEPEGEGEASARCVTGAVRSADAEGHGERILRRDAQAQHEDAGDCRPRLSDAPIEQETYRRRSRSAEKRIVRASNFWTSTRSAMRPARTPTKNPAAAVAAAAADRSDRPAQETPAPTAAPRIPARRKRQARPSRPRMVRASAGQWRRKSAAFRESSMLRNRKIRLKPMTTPMRTAGRQPRPCETKNPVASGPTIANV